MHQQNPTATDKALAWLRQLLTEFVSAAAAKSIDAAMYAADSAAQDLGHAEPGSLHVRPAVAFGALRSLEPTLFGPASRLATALRIKMGDSRFAEERQRFAEHLAAVSAEKDGAVLAELDRREDARGGAASGR